MSGRVFYILKSLILSYTEWLCVFDALPHAHAGVGRAFDTAPIASSGLTLLIMKYPCAHCPARREETYPLRNPSPASQLRQATLRS